MTRFGNIRACVCTLSQTERDIDDEKNGKREEDAESQMGKKKKHLACSQFSFPADVRQRNYSNDHEQKYLTSFFSSIYTALHKKQHDIQKLLLPSVVSPSSL